MPDSPSKAPQTPLRLRRYHTFLSHAHVDQQAVEKLRQWLAMAGIEVWYDAEQVPAGTRFARNLLENIGQSRSLIVAVSHASVESEWVEEELSYAVDQKAPFPVIPVLLENCELPLQLKSRSAVPAFDATSMLSGVEASRLLSSIHGLPDATPPAEASRQIIQMIAAEAGESPGGLERASCPALYVSFGWRNEGHEPELRNAVCKALSGFCLTGDALDHPHTNLQRITAIMNGCAGHVVVVPLRGSGLLDDPEYRSLQVEILTGREVGLPQHFVIESGVDPSPFASAASCTVLKPDPSSPGAWTTPLGTWAYGLQRAIDVNHKHHYVFVATDYDDHVVKDHVVRHISKVTGLPCLRGSDFSGAMPSRKIETAIRGASLVIANIVSKNDPDGKPEVNWNTCIEAGMGIGAGRPVQILARRGTGDTWTIRDNLPFMIRDNSIATYANDAELVALVHRFCRPFRRRILDTGKPV